MPAKDEILKQAAATKANAAKLKAETAEKPKKAKPASNIPTEVNPLDGRERVPDHLRGQAFIEAENARKAAEKAANA